MASSQRSGRKRKATPESVNSSPAEKLASKASSVANERSKKVAEAQKPVCELANSTKTDLKLTSSSSMGRNARLNADFFDKPCLDLAKQLLGQLLVRKLPDGTRVAGKIVETEGYLGNEDPSAHSYNKKTDRNRAMFMAPGTAYVYNIYGTYCCMNISSRGEGHAVLLRALDPVDGLDKMTEFRQKAQKSPTKIFKVKDLCCGPSKFCQALSIDKATINEQDLPTSEIIWLEEGDSIPVESVVVSTRIGIEGAGAEAASKPYRFYVRGNVHVSKRDKEAEKAKNK